MDLVQGGLGRVEGDPRFGFGVVGFGDHSGEIFEGQIDVHGTGRAVEAGEVKNQSC